jgi:SulP family sulfate permease
MTAIDATGLQALENLADVVHDSGRGLILCGAREQPSRLMRDAEFEQHVGPQNICLSIADALERAKLLCPSLCNRVPPEVGWGRRSTDAEPVKEPSQTT